MNKKILIVAGAIVVILVALAVVFSRQPGAASGADPARDPATTDPQRLMIPRWFLRAMTVDGKTFELPEQGITLQFEEGKAANGQSGCNSFGGSYEADKDGKMVFGPLASTLMACEGAGVMEREAAYLGALARVQHFQVVDGKLTLSSTDEKVTLVFGMPPK